MTHSLHVLDTLAALHLFPFQLNCGVFVLLQLDWNIKVQAAELKKERVPRP